LNRKFLKQLEKGEHMEKIISTNERPITSLGIGSKVVLRGDPNSPVMVIISGIAGQNGVQMGWFSPGISPNVGTEKAPAFMQNPQFASWNCIQLATEAIEAANDNPETVH
jgi:hypothetical protein